MLFPLGGLCCQVEEGQIIISRRSLTWKSSLTVYFNTTTSSSPQAGYIYAAVVFGCVWICLDPSSLGMSSHHMTAFPWAEKRHLLKKKKNIYCKVVLKPASTPPSLCYKCTVNTQRTAARRIHDRGSANDQESLYNMTFLPSETEYSPSEKDVALYRKKQNCRSWG